jgi:S-adenosylmethionine-diacylglycerol 3-amino-3-carboxypropyl transferase
MDGALQSGIPIGAHHMLLNPLEGQAQAERDQDTHATSLIAIPGSRQAPLDNLSGHGLSRCRFGNDTTERGPFRHSGRNPGRQDRAGEEANVSQAQGSRSTAESLVSRGAAIRDRTFAHIFKNLSVYSILYEDSEVDERFLEIGPDSTILEITGAGCRTAGHVSQHPRSIDAVDINGHHLALTALKISAVRHVPEQRTLHALFGGAPSTDSRQHLGDTVSGLPTWLRHYWEARRRSLREGLLGRGLTAQLLGWLRFLSGIDESFLRQLIAKPVSARLTLVDELFEPVFRRREVAAVLRSPLCLLALGVNYAQRDRMLSAERTDIVGFVMKHLRKVASTDLARNWFAWFSLAGRFDTEEQEALPPYLRRDRHQRALKAPTEVRYHHRNIFDVLDAAQSRTWSHFTLCDAPDWLPEPAQRKLLLAILRASRDGGVLQYRSVEPTSIVERLGLERHFQRMQVASQTATQLDRTCQYRSVNLYRIVH